MPLLSSSSSSPRDSPTTTSRRRPPTPPATPLPQTRRRSPGVRPLPYRRCPPSSPSLPKEAPVRTVTATAPSSFRVQPPPRPETPAHRSPSLLAPPRPWRPSKQESAGARNPSTGHGDRECHGKGRLLSLRAAVRDAMDLTPSLWFSSLVKVSCSDPLTIGTCWCTSTRSRPSSSPWSFKDRKHRIPSIQQMTSGSSRCAVAGSSSSEP